MGISNKVVKYRKMGKKYKKILKKSL